MSFLYCNNIIDCNIVRSLLIHFRNYLLIENVFNNQMNLMFAEWKYLITLMQKSCKSNTAIKLSCLLIGSISLSGLIQPEILKG